VLRGGSSGNREWTENLKKRLLTHGEVWRDFKHENVCPFYGFSFQHAYMPALVLPFYRNGNIMQFLEREGLKKTGNDKLEFVRGIARGINYLHGLKNPVVHGDIRGVGLRI